VPARKDLKKILIIGSGPIVIGQACEFDYSGTQAVKALKEDGYEVILVNPNPATVMTTPGIADRIYMEPLEVNYLEEIISIERPDAILPTIGGQTGLNLSLDLYNAGVLAKYNVEVIGASINSIMLAEDRGKFKKVIQDIGLEVPRSVIAKSVKDARELQKEVGLPLVIRPSYTLGGKGGSIAYTEAEFEMLVDKALSESPVGEALIEESLIGWKEFEMEVVRDKADNAVIVCSIENVDPMGVHTGDSITVAPIQSLSDTEYQIMRTASLDILRAIGIDCGGSNVQFAVKPDTGRMVVIEMNPRVSRSSALASKATGFPIARCSARLAVGYTLDEILNEVTGKTVSAFEPALDYVAVKIPRFEMEKFPQGYLQLGTQMKSVGESLALGRTFNEALNKAVRSVENGRDGIEALDVSAELLEKMLTTLHPLRIYAIYTVLLKSGEAAIDELNRKSGYDRWFLYNLSLIAKIENSLKKGQLSGKLLLDAKQSGFSDKKIARLSGLSAIDIEVMRTKEGINPSYHFVDTCAGEFSADTPYFYSTFGEIDEGGSVEGEAVIILASGPNRIGQGLEFDTGCTLASIAYRGEGVKSIMVNSNPETVSTDFNVSDRLYIEPLTVEDVKNIIRKEKVKNVVVQLGGQTPLNMAEELDKWGVNIVGTTVESINTAEDRGLFAKMLKKLELRQPDNRTASSFDQIVKCAEEMGYPVLLRPSFVLGGRSMYIAYTREELEAFINRGIEISKEKPVLVDQFLEDAFEYDIDALCDGKNVYIAGIMQHIEAAGIHSGDSACVFPAYKSTPEIIQEMTEATVRIARELPVIGFLNIQYAVKGNTLYVLEVNPRGSRTVPFLSKASGINLIQAAVRIWRGRDLRQQGLASEKASFIREECYIGVGMPHTGWAVKEAVFSFDRFVDFDPILGPEMKSTGEVIGTGDSFGEAFAKAQIAAGTKIPTEGKVFVSVHQNDRKAILPIVRDLHLMGFGIAATRGTANFLFENGIFAEVILKIHEGHPNVIDHMKSRKFALLINTPLGRNAEKGDTEIRIEAVKRKLPYTTTTSAAYAATEGIRYLKKKEILVRPLVDVKGDFSV
jgi:carbamoyl-phosphate synthase large subunit